MGINITTNTMKLLITLLFTSLIYGQADTIKFTLPKTKTVVFWQNDKNEIQNVVNKNGKVLDTLSRSIDLLKGASIRSISKTSLANSSIDVFSLTSANETFAFKIRAVSIGTNFNISQSWDIVFSKGKTGWWINTTGSDNGNNFVFEFVAITGGVKVRLKNESLTLPINAQITIEIGGSPELLTYTQL